MLTKVVINPSFSFRSSAAFPITNPGSVAFCPTPGLLEEVIKSPFFIHIDFLSRHGKAPG